MSAADSPEDELVEHVEDTFGEHRDILERLAEMDTDLSDDAKRALEILDGGQS